MTEYAALQSCARTRFRGCHSIVQWCRKMVPSTEAPRTFPSPHKMAWIRGYREPAGDARVFSVRAYVHLLYVYIAPI